MKQTARRIVEATKKNAENYHLTIRKFLDAGDKNGFCRFNNRFFNVPAGFSAYLLSQRENYSGETESDWNEFASEKLDEFKKENGNKD